MNYISTNAITTELYHWALTLVSINIYHFVIVKRRTKKIMKLQDKLLEE